MLLPDQDNDCLLGSETKPESFSRVNLDKVGTSSLPTTYEYTPTSIRPGSMCTKQKLLGATIGNEKYDYDLEKNHIETPVAGEDHKGQALQRFVKLVITLVVLCQIFRLLQSNAVSRLLYGKSDTHSISNAFLAECESLLEPPHGTQLDRLDKLIEALSPNNGNEKWVWISEPGPSAYYFLGSFATQDWWLSERPFLVGISPSLSSSSPSSSSTSTNGRANITLLTPEFERLRAQLVYLPEEVRDSVTYLPWKESDSPYEVLADYFGHLDGIVLDPMVRSFVENGLGQAVYGKRHRDRQIGLRGSVEDHVEKVDLEVDVKTRVGLIRERKDEREIGLLRCANQVGADD